MRLRAFPRGPAWAVISLAALLGCSGGDGARGDACASLDDCDTTLQCVASVCVPRCVRAPDCGDGYACDEGGVCRIATGQTGDACTSEVDCAPGLACQIEGTLVDETNTLLASCVVPAAGRPAGAMCDTDSDCRNGTCAVGRCVDLCAASRDCALTTACMTVPRGDVDPDTTIGWATFDGCLPARGTITFPLPVMSAIDTDLAFPVPSGTRHASLVMSVDDLRQRVGATELRSPGSSVLHRYCTGGSCTVDQRAATYPVRHAPGVGQSVLAMPSNPDVRLETGMYGVDLQSFAADDRPGSAIPRVTAVLRLGEASVLDLHFYFLDLADHPCRGALGGVQLRAASAASENFFQSDFLGALRTILTNNGGVSLGGITYEDLPDHPELDGLDIADAGSLLKLGTHADGINVFFVRTLSPVGLQGFAPGPGPGGIAETRQSGIVIGVDNLCYRSWSEVARLAAHAMARYMGLYRNADVARDYDDPIADSPRPGDVGVEGNLMYFSELGGGAALSPGQREILLRSPVLR